MNLPTLIIIGLGMFMLVSMFKNNVETGLGNIFQKPQSIIDDAKTKIDGVTTKAKESVPIPIWVLVIGGILLLMVMKK